MTKAVFTIDVNEAPEQQQIKTHNRWHPDIPIVETFKPEDTFRVECYDWTGGQIANNDFAKQNGGGFLTERFPDARKSCWDISGIYATSRHVPGVRYPGMVHPGLIGCLPDRKLLDEANRREAALIATNPNRVLQLAAPPSADFALMGQMSGAQAAAAAKPSECCRRRWCSGVGVHHCSRPSIERKKAATNRRWSHRCRRQGRAGRRCA